MAWVKYASVVSGKSGLECPPYLLGTPSTGTHTIQGVYEGIPWFESLCALQIEDGWNASEQPAGMLNFQPTGHIMVSIHISSIIVSLVEVSNQTKASGGRELQKVAQ
eukprot:11386933-Karenia_brevis.AAC.1